MERSSGILLPISSLPSKYGIGTLGREAYRFADELKAAGQTYWQVLPLGPTSYGDSPYQSFSTFAGNPYFIDLELLAEDGLLSAADLEAEDWGDTPRYVDYGKIYAARFRVLRRAFAAGYPRDREAVEQFIRENHWVRDYALFMALKNHFGMKSWLEWEDREIALHHPKAVVQYTRLLAEDIRFYIYLQYLFFRQWKELKTYINGLGIRVIGDLPIYVALDSADVWAEPEFFQLDSDNRPVEVAGVPPDYFSADGQLWGNPLYDYDRMQKDGFGWWIRRVEGASRLFDVVRIDHFRGLESYWAVPYGETTARNGRWRKGPGMALVGVLTSWFHQLHFIAEDLGFLTPAVHQLLADSGLPGMKVLEFAFDPQQLSAPYIHPQLHLLRWHPRQRDPAPVGGRGGCGDAGLRPGVSGHRRGRAAQLGHPPRRDAQRGRYLCGPAAGLPGAGGGGPDERARHHRGQLALAPAARRAGRRADRNHRPLHPPLRPQLRANSEKRRGAKPTASLPSFYGNDG